MSFVSTDPVSHKGETNSWLTPLSLVHALGEFDLDPCGFNFHRTAKEVIQLPENGLSREWHGRIWLNPPYGKHQQEWLHRMNDHKNGIALIFARLETKWIQKFIADGFFMIEGRIKFLKEDLTESSNAGCGSILIPFSGKDERLILQSNIKGRFYR